MRALPVLFLLTAIISVTGCQHSGTDFVPATDWSALEVHPALRVRPVPAGLGVNIHFYEGNERDWEMITAAGMGIIRMDVSWSGGEPEPGRYDFSRYDALINRLDAHGIRLLFILDYGNSLYDDGAPPHSTEALAASARFCGTLATRYAGRDIIWELWNEPNLGKFWPPEPDADAYMAWCNAVTPAIRAADPGACIVAPATAGIARGFLEACFERGLLDLVDGITVHPYRPAWPETALREYERVARLIKQYQRPGDGRYIPVISGEWGYTSTEHSPEEQGKYLARQWLMNLAHGIPISIWYDWHDDGQDPEEREHNFGTVTWDYEAKPAYLAMKTLIEELGGYTCMGRNMLCDDDIYFAVFRRGDEYKVAAWCKTPGNYLGLIPHEPGNRTITRAVSHAGAEVPVPDNDGLFIYDAPVYLTFVSPPPAWITGEQ